jgi:hypothetical protein
VLVVLEIEKVQTQFFFGDEIGRLVVVFGQLPNGTQIRVLCLGG